MLPALNVDGLTYRYEIMNVKVRIVADTGGKTYMPLYPEVTGLTWPEIEKGILYGYFEIKPAQVQDWIRKNVKV